MLNPSPGLLIVKPIKEEKKETASGIILATKTEDRSAVGLVVAMGMGRLLADGVSRETTTFGVGSMVVYDAFQAIPHEEYLIIRQQDVMGWLEEAE